MTLEFQGKAEQSPSSQLLPEASPLLSAPVLLRPEGRAASNPGSLEAVSIPTMLSAQQQLDRWTVLLLSASKSPDVIELPFKL